MFGTASTTQNLSTYHAGNGKRLKPNRILRWDEYTVYVMVINCLNESVLSFSDDSGTLECNQNTYLCKRMYED